MIAAPASSPPAAQGTLPKSPHRGSPPPYNSPDTYTSLPIPADLNLSQVTEDLQNQLADWKGHPISALGPLHIFDDLTIRQGARVRYFRTYLFQEAIIFIFEEKKTFLGGLFGTWTLGPFASNASGLRLKGRIYLRHIKGLLDTSTKLEPSLNIAMKDPSFEAFTLAFRDHASLEDWRGMIQGLVDSGHFNDSLDSKLHGAGDGWLEDEKDSCYARGSTDDPGRIQDM